MTIEYGVSEYLLARYGHAAARRRGGIRSRRQYYFVVTWSFAIACLGAFSAFSALSLGGSIIFLLIGFVLGISILKGLIWIRSYDRQVEEDCFPRYLDREQIKVRLEITNEGIREIRSNVVLSAEWGDVVSTSLEDDLLGIALKGLRVIVIPRVSFGMSDLGLESIQDELEQLRKSAN